MACRHAFLHGLDGLLSKVLVDEGSEDVRLLVNGILQYLAAIGAWYSFYFEALITEYLAC